jgi:hypothetical protein
MYFFADSKDQTVVAFLSMGAAAKAVLKKLNVTLSPGTDPVKLAQEELGDRGWILNLSGAFEAIAESDDQAAQELASQFKQAVEQYYER